MCRKFREKFPDRITELEAFLYNALTYIRIVTTPEEAVEAEGTIRDPKDRPILRSAWNAHADLFLTGDKDFIESSVTDSRIINVESLNAWYFRNSLVRANYNDLKNGIYWAWDFAHRLWHGHKNHLSYSTTYL